MTPATVFWITDIARSLREGFFMFWETLWPLVLGFGLSGAVQAFVSRDAMRRSLGDHRPPAVLRATGYGMVSSSCSYAASAMSKSLVAKGADFVSAMVFMFASTNLVIELGIVLVVLMGWQFAASEFIGGIIMITLLALLGGAYFRGRVVVEARRRLEAATAGTGEGHGPGGDPSGATSDAATAGTALRHRPWRTRLGSRAGWADAATYTMADLTMLRKELVGGYVIAGFLATLVPVSAWNALFLQGHGFWTSLENVIVGPFIALISFVCSVGNVPLAAALWHGGISFGGVVSFIFGDLITLPLLLIYRRYYGGRLALRMLGIFWLVMAVAGLVTEGIFVAAGWVPASRPAVVAAPHFSWNYTTYLNIVFLALFAFLYWIHRHRAAWGAGQGYAIDPVCGMQVETAHAPASTVHAGRTVFFCSDRCLARFEADPGRFTRPGARHEPMEEAAPVAVRFGRSTVPAASDGELAASDGEPGGGSAAGPQAVDPVCGMTVDTSSPAARRVHEGLEYFFCNPGCAAAFDADPARYLTG